MPAPSPPRSIVLACIDPWVIESDGRFFSFGVRRVHAALVASPRLAGSSIHLVEDRTADVGALTAAIEAHDPDLVAFSAFVWSLPTFVEVARRLKRRRPDRVVVFGGPSARPSVLSLPPWRDSGRFIDVLVLGEGEQTLERIAAESPRTPAEFAAIGGVAIPNALGWRTLGSPARVAELGTLPSPYRFPHGLPPGGILTFESFRGCPIACSFCQWGEPSQTARAFSEDYLTHELRALRDLKPSETVLADAAINLNPRGFRNLAAAEREVRALRDIPLTLEIYPLGLRDEHKEFLANVNVRGMGIGLQSYNPEVLRRLDRPSNTERFESTVRQAAEFGPVMVEFICGLPGDTPESFWRTVDLARRLPAGMRIYHCLILPDALLTRMPEGCVADFDPVTLRVRSCTGWTEADLARTAVRLTELSGREGGVVVDGFWWDLPGDASSYRPILRRQGAEPAPGAPDSSPPPGPARALHSSRPTAKTTETLRAALAQTTTGWRIDSVDLEPHGVLLGLVVAEGPLLVDVRPAVPGRGSFCIVDGLAIAYRPGPTRPSAATLKALPEVMACLKGFLWPLISLDAPGGQSDVETRCAQATPAPDEHVRHPEEDHPRDAHTAGARALDLQRLADSFWANGYVAIDGFFTPELVRACHDALGGSGGGPLTWVPTLGAKVLQTDLDTCIAPPDSYPPPFDRLTADPRLRELSQAILGAGYLDLYLMLMRFSEKGLGGPWHQDCVSGNDVPFCINRLIYPQPAGDGAGGELVVVPGSHRGVLPEGAPHGSLPGERVIKPRAGMLVMMHGALFHRVGEVASVTPRFSINFRAAPQGTSSRVTSVAVYRNLIYHFDTNEIVPRVPQAG